MIEAEDKSLEKILEIVEQFNKAEQSIKNAEIAEGRISLTPINQIRYSFKHLTQAIKSYEQKNFIEFDKNIGKSLGHCKRSFYDACDAEISFYIKEFNAFVKYAHDERIVISSCIPFYGDWVSIVVNTKKFLAQDQHDIEDKDKRYEKILEYLKDIKPISIALPGAYEIVNEKLEIEKRLQNQLIESSSREKSTNRFARISVGVSVLAIVVAIGVVIFDEPLKKILKSISSSKIS